jgi:hypothetical protein
MHDILDDISPESTRKYTKLDYYNYYYTGRKGPSPNLNAGQRQRRGGEVLADPDLGGTEREGWGEQVRQGGKYIP